jgi:hypothetical protein
MLAVAPLSGVKRVAVAVALLVLVLAGTRSRTEVIQAYARLRERRAK